jgi:molybdenum cofactor cytidylyltransferase
MRAPSFAAVILAAGLSSRMGRDKALLPWRSGTFLSEAIDSLYPNVDFVLVVAGANAPLLKPIVDARGAFLIVNPFPEHGQFSSLRVGLNEVLNRGRDAAIITLVDRPAVASSTVARLKEEFLISVNERRPRAEETWAMVPEQHGRHGHPFIAGREMIEAFLRADAGSNAREVLHAHASHVRHISLPDPYLTLNINTPEDYAALGESISEPLS